MSPKPPPQVRPPRPTANGPSILKFFEYSHLPANLQEVSKPFAELADRIANRLKPGPERAEALRCLLRAKDAAVRAKLYPGH